MESDAAAMEVLDSATAGLDPILRESALAHVSGDLHRYLRILDMLDNVLDLTPLEGIRAPNRTISGRTASR